MQQEAAGVYQTVTYLLLPPKIGNGNRYIFLCRPNQKSGSPTRIQEQMHRSTLHIAGASMWGQMPFNRLGTICHHPRCGKTIEVSGKAPYAPR